MVDRSMKILIVDDFSSMRRIIRKILKRLGFSNLHEADDGSTALSMLRKDHFDFVISDWNMPNMGGLDLLRAVRADERLKDLPFMMVTAEAKKENIIEAVRSGATNYIIKPFTEETLHKKMQQVFP